MHKSTILRRLRYAVTKTSKKVFHTSFTILSFCRRFSSPSTSPAVVLSCNWIVITAPLWLQPANLPSNLLMLAATDDPVTTSAVVRKAARHTQLPRALVLALSSECSTRVCVCVYVFPSLRAHYFLSQRRRPFIYVHTHAHTLTMAHRAFQWQISFSSRCR